MAVAKRTGEIPATRLHQEFTRRGLSMQTRSLFGSAILALSLGGTLFAQEPAPTPVPDAAKPPAEAVVATPAAPAVDVPAKLTLPEGSDVHLKFAQDVSSKTAADDDPVALVLDEDLKIGDVILIKAGAKAVGTITHAKKAGMMGKAGELNLRLEYMIVGDSRLRLRGTKGKEGEGKVGTAVALTVLFGPIGLIKHGKNVEIKQGTPLLVYTDAPYAGPPAT